MNEHDGERAPSLSSLNTKWHLHRLLSVEASLEDSLTQSVNHLDSPLNAAPPSSTSRRAALQARLAGDVHKDTIKNTHTHTHGKKDHVEFVTS